jgi:hypothetical protein
MKKNKKPAEQASDRTVLLNLSDTEWVSLIDGNSYDSGLPICCANISALRDVLVSILRNGRKREIGFFDMQELRKCLKWVADDHDLSPTVKKLSDQIGFNSASEEHKADRREV